MTYDGSMHIMTSLVYKTAIDGIDAAPIVCLGLDLGEDNSCILPGELSNILKKMGSEGAFCSVDKMKTIKTIAQTTENVREFSNLHQFRTAVASIISVAVYAGNVHSVTTVSIEEVEIYTYSFGYSFIIQCCVPVVVCIGGVLALTEKKDGKEVGH